MINRKSIYEIEGLPDFDESFRIPKDHLILKEEIGKGGFGVVYRADYLGIDVAVKQISAPGGEDDMEEIFVRREIAILKSCRHPNLVAFLGVVEQATADEGIQIVLEYLPGGDLGRFLLDSKEPISYATKIKISLDVACGMAYLHSRNIIFRDIKSENLLMDECGKVKICDFGFARKFSKKYRPTTRCGTDEFMAPEIILGKDYDQSADVFSYGMLLFEIITRKDVGKLIPRSVDNGYRINEDNLRKQLSDCPKHFIELGILCTRFESKKRPSFVNIIDFLKKLMKITPDER
jgi:LIM domain kinase 1